MKSLKMQLLLLIKKCRLELLTDISIISLEINYLPLTTVLNFLPAENTGTVLAGIEISLPV